MELGFLRTIFQLILPLPIEGKLVGQNSNKLISVQVMFCLHANRSETRSVLPTC